VRFTVCSRLFLLTCLLVVFVALVDARLSPLYGSQREARSASSQKGQSGTSEVVALWQFSPGMEGADNSGNGHSLKLRGESRFAPGGKSESCLECFATESQRNKPQGAVVKNHPRLSPPGAFTIEMWIRPKEEIRQVNHVFLLDKKYYNYPKDVPEANCDYCLCLRRVQGSQYRLEAHLGFGKDSVSYESQMFPLEPGQWVHVAFSYDGRGTGRFAINEKFAGRTHISDRGPITPGKWDLVIGDRYGSLFAPFPGFIDEVRILGKVAEYFSDVELIVVPGTRAAFLRGEPEPALRLLLANGQDTELAEMVVEATLPQGEYTVTVGKLKPSEQKEFWLPIDPWLRPGRYQVPMKVRDRETGKLLAEQVVSFNMVRRRLPNQMPVILWGTGDLDLVQEIGFTHQIVPMVDYERIWEAGEVTEAVSPGRVRDLANTLDEYAVRGLGAVAYLYPASWVMREEKLRERFQRIDRQGKPYSPPNACGLFPELNEYCYRVGASVGRTFKDFPAWEAALIQSELRDGTHVCFHSHDLEAFRAHAGFEIPEAATSKWGVKHGSIPGFPKNRVLPNNDPLLVFYRWFWSEGDGWNRLHSAVHRGIKDEARPDVWTFFDPAVRTPSIWGSGGEVDVISQWTYTYPDPIKIGLATDELMAMAEGSGSRQKVMKMTQIIWYRSQTAPELPEDPARRAAWEKEIPDARFITIAPDHLREAFWIKISRPIRGIMYHGWGSLVDAGPNGYRYTNPETKEVLSQLIREVIRPLGPTLLALEDCPADVALLESFTAQMFARRGTFGWGNSWEADIYLALQWARLPSRVVYEQTILEHGLKPYRVLVLPACDVLPESVVAAIGKFQEEGGVIVGDELLCPAIKPDLVLNRVSRTQQPDKDKAALQQIARQLRDFLKERGYSWSADSSNPDILVRLRRAGNAQYLFVVNDRRTFGNYVGHHGRVMEMGVPIAGEVSVLRAGGVVYDLLKGQPVPAKSAGGRLQWNVELGSGQGTLFMIVGEPIHTVRLTAPPVGDRGKIVPLRIAVVGAKEKPVDAAVPVEVQIVGPDGELAEPSGFYATQAGELEILWQVATNETLGPWRVQVRELASGKEAKFQVAIR